MNEMCNDNRFGIIEKAKKHILESTNISMSPEEMAVLDNMLFRCWQMGWLDKYTPRDDGIYVEFFAVKDGIKYHSANVVNFRELSSTLTTSILDGIEKICFNTNN